MTQTDWSRVLPPGPAGGRSYYMFILSAPGRGLSLGVTNDLARFLVERRLSEPADPAAARLVYFEIISDLGRAMARKAQLEGWNRSKKWRLVVSANPDLRDLSAGLAERRES